MDIDLSVLRLMEREREIPFEELVAMMVQADLKLCDSGMTHEQV